MIPTTTIGSVRRIQDAWETAGVSREVQASVESKYRRAGGHVRNEIARAGRVKSATARRSGRRESQQIASVSKRVLNRVQTAMGMMGAGLGTSTAGLGWDYYVHEIAKEAGESIFAAPHLRIFVGFGITGLGFLVALVGARSLFAPLRSSSLGGADVESAGA